jgi:hypothetical protein
MPWQSELGWATLRVLSVHHLDCFRYWFGEPEAIYCSVRTDPRTKFPHTDGICTYILEYASGLRCVGIDDPWTGPAKEGCPADIYLRWRIEGLNGLAIGDIGWCRDPCTTPSTIKFAAKGDAGFHEPKWTESWFPDAFIGTMAQLLIALETGTEPAISAADNLKTMSLVDAACSSAQQLAAVNLKSFKVRSALVDGELEKPGIFSQLLSKPYAGSVKPEPEPVSNFTPRAQQVLALAREEAERFNHNFIGTEHLLIGLIALGQGVAVNVLAKLGLDLEKVRKEVEKEIGAGPDPEIIGNLSYTPRVRKVLAFASKEARNLKHTYVGTEHILLGLLREGDGVAADVLKNLGVDIERTRTEILKELDPKIAEAPRTLDETEIAGILKELDLKLEELRGKLGQTEIQKRGVLRRLVLKLSGSAGPQGGGTLQPQFRRHRAPFAGPHQIRPGNRRQRLAEARPGPGSPVHGDRNERRHRPRPKNDRQYPPYSQSHESPRARLQRGQGFEPHLHWHRTHFAGTARRRRRRGGPGAQEPQR